MNTDAIDKEFNTLIAEKGIHKKLRVTNSLVTTLRYNLKNGIPVSLDKKLSLLHRSGWRQDDKIYDQKDLVAAVRFALSSSAAAKAHGPEYLVEKFLALSKSVPKGRDLKLR